MNCADLKTRIRVNAASKPKAHHDIVNVALFRVVSIKLFNGTEDAPEMI